MDRIIEKKRGLQKKHIPYIAGGAFVLIVLLWIVFGNHQRTLQVDAYTCVPRQQQEEL